METKTLRGSCLKRRTLKTSALSLALLAGVAGLPQLALAQNHSVIYNMNTDVKHYTTKSVPGNGDESAMVGTLFGGSTGLNNAHFLRLDNVGNVNFSVEYVSGYDDERAVDMQPIEDPNTGNNYWLITCLARDGAGAEDRVRVLCVDDAGAIHSQQVYDASNFGGEHMYPKHSTVWTDPNTGDMLLFICGYTTTGNTTLPSSPDYTSNKQAFAMAVDVNFGGSHLNFVKAEQYDWGSVSGYDYDMAMHIEVLEMSNELYMTGSVSGENVGAWGGRASRSATMNSVLDPYAPMGIPMIVDKPFLEATGQDNNDGPHDYGQDLIQVGGQLYLLGNFAREGTPPWNYPTPTPQNAMYPRYGHGWHITPLKDDFTPLTRWHFWIPQQHWARNAMVTPNGDVVIATMLAVNYRTCLITPPGMPYFYPNHDNVLPNLIKVSLNGNSQPIATDSKIFMTQNGTGDPAATASNYYTLGTPHTMLGYEPTFADVGDNQFIISAPRTIGTNNTLGIRYLNPDLGLNIACTDSTCIDTFIALVNKEDLPGMPMPLDMEETQTPIFVTAQSFMTQAAQPCQDFFGGPGYKPGGNGTLNTTTIARLNAKTKLYPNPASDAVRIDLGNSIASDGKVEVKMMNIYGQDLGALYAGTAQGLSGKELKLPSRAAGLYLIHVYVDGALVYKEKLTVQ